MKLTPRRQAVYQQQDRILTALKKIRRFPFILSGGTALSRFYFRHRFSDDLDFFHEGFDFSFAEIEGIIAELRTAGFACEAISRTDRPRRLKFSSYGVGRDPTLPAVKLDFLEDPFSGMWKPTERRADSGVVFRVDALDQIYYRKFYSIIEQEQRVGTVDRVKDLVDLYCLHKSHRPIDETVELFSRERIPILEETILMIFDRLKLKDLNEGLMRLGALPWTGREIRKEFRRVVQRLLAKRLPKRVS